MLKRFITALAVVIVSVGGGAIVSQAAAPAAPWPSSVDATRPPIPGAPTKGKMTPKGLPPIDANTKAFTTCGTNCYSYATVQQSLSATDQADGASLTADIDLPYLSSGIQGDMHSLFEMAVRDSTGDQVIEVGWNSDVITNPNGQTHLFVGSWTNGSFNGYNGGGGWVDAVGCAPCAGDSISTAVGTAKAFKVEHNAGTSKWEVSYNASIIGTFPDSTWSGGFTKTRLVQVFTELASVNVESCSDMGDGNLATSSAGTLATSFALINSTASPSLSTGTVTNSAAWAVNLPSATSARLGGPGYNSAGGANGTAGTTGRCAPATAGTCTNTACAWAEKCPDGTTTGCNMSTNWNAGVPVGTCVAINGGAGVEFNAWQNTSTTGKSWLVFRTAACTGSSQLMSQNAGGTAHGVWPAGWTGTAIHAHQRAS